MLFIPAVIMITPIAILVIFLRYRSEQSRQRYHTLLQLAEKGVELPHDLLVEPRSADTDRRRALVLIGGGLGLTAMFLALPFEFHSGQRIAGLWGLGLPPLMTGLGYLVNWRLNQRDDIRA
ncbi:DUF6249 domain-containing protein [Arenimonas sp. GDDSR-1]|uniref:DUF6249 domain-containing protein n=1 Tax=Arenimonas sp. GDDSR-1 TaxID=2950125 RepID=UPI00261607B2|nr:DUF6249 domain-containing protein [Arenimonas sp. GDDSR-1]